MRNFFDYVVIRENKELAYYIRYRIGENLLQNKKISEKKRDKFSILKQKLGAIKDHLRGSDKIMKKILS